MGSFGGGCDLWGSADGDHNGDDSDDGSLCDDSDEDSGGRRRPSLIRTLSMSKQEIHDGLLEVVGVRGSIQLGAAQIGLYTASRLAQAAHVKITTKAALPVQVDGEPWLFAKDGEIDVTWKSHAFMLARSPQSAHAV